MTGASDQIAALADDLAHRRKRDLQPAPLLLGSGCARAAGAPPAHFAARLFDWPGLSAKPPELAADAGGTEVARAVRSFLAELDPLERDALAAAASADLPVPLFLQDLALLIREGTFPLVFTTAVDTLLERALDLLGLRPGLDFTVHHVSERVSADLSDMSGITIVKLYGDATEPLGNQIRSHLGRTGVVAYVDRDDPPVADELMLAAGGGRVWWVGDPPPVEDREGLRRTRDCEFIYGGGAEPESFFAYLGFLLIQMPAINLVADPGRSRRKAAEEGISTGPGVPAQGRVAEELSTGTLSGALALVGGTKPPESPEELERLLAGWRRRRCRETLVRLEHGTGTLDRAAVGQIEYQRVALEQLDLAAEPAQRPEWDAVIAVLDRVRADPRLAADPDVAGLVASLSAKVSDQLRKPEPDRRVVGAALTGVTAIAKVAGVERRLLEDVESANPARPA